MVVDVASAISVAGVAPTAC